MVPGLSFPEESLVLPLGCSWCWPGGTPFSKIVVAPCPIIAAISHFVRSVTRILARRGMPNEEVYAWPCTRSLVAGRDRSWYVVGKPVPQKRTALPRQTKAFSRFSRPMVEVGVGP